MTRRTILAASDEAAHRAWIAAATAAVFHMPTRFPTLRKPKLPAEPEQRLPDLFRDLLNAMDAMPEPEAEAPVGVSPGDLLRSHFGDALPGPSALTVRRRELRRQRDAAKVEVQPEPVATEPAPVPADDAMARLVASGIANEYIAGLGALRDPDAPFSPRSIGFPVTVHRVGGPFQPPSAPRIWELHLSTPACGDLPFVRRVEEVMGLKARWAPDAPRGICGQWAHAVDLANDADWERLASSMEHTTPEGVSRAAGIHVGYGSLSVANARLLLLAVGVAELETRACPNLQPLSGGGLQALYGWEAIHAVEDGLVVPGNPKRHTYAQVTEAGWRSVGKDPPTKDELKTARKAARQAA